MNGNRWLDNRRNVIVAAVAAVVVIFFIAIATIYFGAGQSEQEKKIIGALLAMGIAVGSETVCNVDEIHDREIVSSYLRTVVALDRRREFADAFLAGFGRGLAVRNDRNYPAVCSSAISTLDKVEWARKFLVESTR